LRKSNTPIALGTWALICMGILPPDARPTPNNRVQPCASSCPPCVSHYRSHASAQMHG
jgi:hypothetical protein